MHGLENWEVSLCPDRPPIFVDDVLEVDEAGLAIFADDEAIADDQIKEGYYPLLPAIGRLLLSQVGPVRIPLGDLDRVASDIGAVLVGKPQDLLGTRQSVEIIPERRFRILMIRVRVLVVQRNGRYGRSVDFDVAEMIGLRFFDGHDDHLPAVYLLPADIRLILADHHRDFVIDERAIILEKHDVAVPPFRGSQCQMASIPFKRDLERRELLQGRHVRHFVVTEDQHSNVRLHRPAEAYLHTVDAAHVTMRRHQTAPGIGSLLNGSRQIEIGCNLELTKLTMLPGIGAHVAGAAILAVRGRTDRAFSQTSRLHRGLDRISHVIFSVFGQNAQLNRTPCGIGESKLSNSFQDHISTDNDKCQYLSPNCYQLRNLDTGE